MKNRTLIGTIVAAFLSAAMISGCGVKADPQPPLTPAEIGRGKPLYKSNEDTRPVVYPRKKTLEDEQNDQDSDENQ